MPQSLYLGSNEKYFFKTFKCFGKKVLIVLVLDFGLHMTSTNKSELICYWGSLSFRGLGFNTYISSLHPHHS